MNFSDLLAALTPEQYEVLKRSVELGKWPDGRLLTTEEKESSLQVLIAYDICHKPVDERIGYVDTQKNTLCEDEHSADKNIILKH